MPSATASAVSASQPDYSDPAYCGTLMRDHWLTGDDSKFALVPTSLLADVHRSSNAIVTIARLVSNSLCEPSMSSAEPLGHAAHLGLLNAAEIIGKYLNEVADRMAEGVQKTARHNDSAEVCRG